MKGLIIFFFILILSSCQREANSYMNQHLQEFLNNDLNSISCNYTTIEVASKETFEEIQEGYRVNPNTGESLIGKKEGDWKESWFVIGYMEGDPIFVDTETDAVYTASHGEGEWEPELISRSLKSFELMVTKYKQLSVNRETPNKFETNPLSEEEIEDYEIAVEKDNSNADFWMMLVE